MFIEINKIKTKIDDGTAAIIAESIRMREEKLRISSELMEKEAAVIERLSEYLTDGTKSYKVVSGDGNQLIKIKDTPGRMIVAEGRAGELENIFGERWRDLVGAKTEYRVSAKVRDILTGKVEDPLCSLADKIIACLDIKEDRIQISYK